MEPSSREIQLKLIKEHHLQCSILINETTFENDDLYCPTVWDGILCWTSVPPGTLLELPCPAYISGFDANATASKQCEEDGTWGRHPLRNDTWSNYTACQRTDDKLLFQDDSVYKMHLPVITYISQVGYSISLTLLILACLILGSIRRLRCPRNSLHLQLFLSFILRAAVTLLRYFVHKEGAETVMCRALTSIWHYFLTANYCWILMEGLYLHNLLFLAMFSDTTGILKYGVAGWGLPVIFLIPWIIARAQFEDELCWTVNNNPLIFWIIRGPITISILLNLFFFLNITRVLFLKMFSNEALQNRRYRYRKWFKSTLILVPLFGVHYALLLCFTLPSHDDKLLEVVWLYIDQTFSSFQGSFVAFLYCFLNGEVKAEVRKVIERLREHEGGATHQHSLITQSLTYLSKGRASVQSLHTVAERRDNWKNGDTAGAISDKQNWGETVTRQAQAESLL